MAAIDMAAWDVLSRSAGLSLSRFLGGEEKPIPTYHSLGLAGPEGAANSPELQLWKRSRGEVAAGTKAASFEACNLLPMSFTRTAKAVVVSYSLAGNNGRPHRDVVTSPSLLSVQCRTNRQVTPIKHGKA
jgi:L-alanine-DL-glutamate epimerase-like enolase superfamily enzyme